MEPSHSRIVRIATFLENHLETSFRVGLYGVFFFASSFLIYVVIGYVAGLFGIFNPPYPFLSLESDQFFVIGGAITGLFIVQSAGSFVLYHFLVGAEDDRSQFAIMMGLISLGFGGALLRVTFPTAISMLTKIF